MGTSEASLDHCIGTAWKLRLNDPVRFLEHSVYSICTEPVFSGASSSSLSRSQSSTGILDPRIVKVVDKNRETKNASPLILIAWSKNLFTRDSFLCQTDFLSPNWNWETPTDRLAPTKTLSQIAVVLVTVWYTSGSVCVEQEKNDF